ncbi:MAG: hypothetical protein DMG32_07695 [Acidobacteria bacterium]|nr:MAG: hypothetical protein DMG32_07695 [Acidobacteriota bacterium]
MNPFDLRAAVLARHAQHVVIIHFPIALFICGVAFDLVAVWRHNRALAVAAYYNLVAAAISALPAVATGLMAWQLQLGGKTPRGNLRLHLALALLSSSAMWVVWHLHVRAQRKFQPALSTVRLAFEIATAVLIALTGHLGGFLSGVNGPA